MAFKDAPASQTLTLKIKGLYTNSNEISEVPDGAQKIADNIWISKDSIAEPRRGFTYLTYGLPNSSDRADTLGQYQNKLLIHYNNTGTTNANDSLAYYDTSTGVHTYTGAYAHPDPLLARMKFAESNRNIYFTTAKGVYKNDLITSEPVIAGMYPGLDCQASLSVNASGFMSNNTQVAYRVVWGITDANNNLILGAPSQRSVVSNSSGGLSDTSVQITIPSGITVNHFYQLYRSNQSSGSTVEPDDNMQLVYETNPTSGEVAALTLTVIDKVPDSLRGSDLYTNATQEGALQPNNRPPYCLDLTLFQTCMFFANTQTAQILELTILSVGGSSGVASGDVITIAGVTYTGGASENVGTRTFKVTTSGSPSQNITDTALSLIRVINQSSSTTALYAFYSSTSEGLPGMITLQGRIFGGTAFTVTASAHGTAYSPTLPTSGSTVISTNTANLNGLMYSKPQQPESVPFLNIFYVGSANQPIRRIVQARNSLFIFKDDGVFRCTGSPGNFSIDTLDATTTILAPESAVTLNNSVYVLATEGVCAVSDNGSQVMSRPIEDQLVSLEGLALNAMRYYSFGCAYESERQYNCWTVTTGDDTLGAQNFIYNFFTKTWVRSTRTQKHAIILSSDNKMYVANEDSNYISQERKDYSFTDYSDEAIAVTIMAIGGGGATLTLSDASQVETGDVISQSALIYAVVDSVNYVTNVVTMDATVSGFTVAAASLLKAIPCLIEWLPDCANNPGYLRHFRELTMIFKKKIVNKSTVNFYNEISSSVDEVEVSGSAPGGWGLFGWGLAPWGGVARSSLFRTYIPLEKQRCCLLSVQFSCSEAYAEFQLEGLSTIFRTIGERTTK